MRKHVECERGVKCENVAAPCVWVCMETRVLISAIEVAEMRIFVLLLFGSLSKDLRVVVRKEREGLILFQFSLDNGPLNGSIMAFAELQSSASSVYNELCTWLTNCSANPTSRVRDVSWL